MKGNGYDPRHHRNGRSDSERVEPEDPEVIKDRMAQLRRGLQADAAHLAKSAQQATDWKFYVRKFPLVCAGVALVVGYSLVPKKSKRDGPITATDEQLERLAKSGKLKVVNEGGKKEQPGLVHKAAFALGGIALRLAMDHMSQSLTARGTQTPSHNGHPSRPRES